MKQYTGKFFKEDMPEWKKKKDITLVRVFYRPISFYVAAFCANHGIQANDVSYFSLIMAMIGCICFVPHNYWIHILGAVLIIIWEILDCVDGNLARSVKAQPFGDFADGLSSGMYGAYIYLTAAIAAYYEGGFLFQAGDVIIIILGALACISNIFTRYVFQRYINHEKELEEKGMLKAEIPENRDKERVTSPVVHLFAWASEGGIVPPLLLLTAILRILDVFVLYGFVIYMFFEIVNLIRYIRKAIVKTAEIEAGQAYEDK